MDENNADKKTSKSDSLLWPSAIILIHGVYSEGEWYTPLLQWADSLAIDPPYAKPLVIPFSWGEYTSRRQGGHLMKAADEVHQMFRNQLIGYDRLYQGHSAARLKELIDACNALGLKVNVMAHSNGSMLLVGALLLGAMIDNGLLMGSPLDCDNEVSQYELNQASKQVRGILYNLWNHSDAWATLKGGIGAFGDNNVFIERNPQIYSIAFVHGAWIRGHRVYSFQPESTLGTEKFNPAEAMKFHHGDYFRSENTPILLEFIKEFYGETKEARAFSAEVIEGLLMQADWTQTEKYKEQKNVSMDDPLMQKYKEGVDKILHQQGMHKTDAA